MLEGALLYRRSVFKSSMSAFRQLSNSASHSNLYSYWPVTMEAISKLTKDVKKLTQTNRKLCLNSNGTTRSLDPQVCERISRGGRYSPEIWMGVCGPSLETLILFQTKLCDFPYPISDLTQNSTLYFRPDPYPISIA